MEKILSIIIVNYRSEKYLNQCLASIFAIWGQEHEIIVVNNDKDEALASISEKFPLVKIIQQPENIGFGAAHNVGIRHAQGKYVLCLNPDTEALEKIDVVLDYFEKNTSVAAIGLKLLNNSGQAQKWIAGTEINPRRLIKNKFLGDTLPKNGAKILQVDWVSGGAMFIKKEIFEAVGGFDENFFMYFEDMDFCKRVRQIGGEVFYFSNISLRHIEGGSSENKIKQKKYYYASQDYYFRKHFGLITSIIVKVVRKIFI
jgi:GT2 family glycosyltransferase